MGFKKSIYFLLFIVITINCDAQSFKISASPKTQRITKYQAAGFQITAIASGGFTASINLGGFSSSLPTASYSFSVNPLNSPYSTPSQATVSYSSEFPIGKHTIIFKGYNGPVQSLDTVNLEVVESIGIWTVFNTSNSGLPSNNITCLQTDKNNNIWIGTQAGGIARYDGTFWTVYNKSNSGIYSDSISSIAVDSANNIWVSFIYKGYLDYPTISKFNGSIWINHKSNINFSWPFSAFSSKAKLSIDNDKNMFLLIPDNNYHNCQLLKYNGISWTQYNNNSIGVNSTIILNSLVIDKTGNKWIASSDSGLLKFDGITWKRFNIANSNIFSDYISNLSCDSNGTIWLAYNYSSNISNFNGTTFTHFNSNLSTNHIENARNGIKWLAQNGLTKFDNLQWRNYNTSNSKIHSNNISCSKADVNGNVWVGSTDNGLAKYTESSSATLWLNSIIIRDGNGTGSSKTLIFGQDDNATDGLDIQLGELELPPVPPAGIFDARFFLPSIPQVASVTDYRNSLSNPISWVIQFQSGVAGYPIKFTWDNTKLPINGNFFLKDLNGGTTVNINMKNVNSYTLSNSNITSLKIEYSSQQCVDFNTQSNWNIVSVPVQTSNMTVQSIFPNAISQAFYYENGYIATNSLVNSKGYWIKFNSAQQNSICGIKIWSPISLNTGWNLIGAFENDIPVNQIATTPNGIITSSFFLFENGYVPATTLLKGKGFWVKSSQNGTINVPTLLFSKSTSRGIEFSEFDKKVFITDNIGNSQTLYLTNLQTDLSGYELPPIPPQGIADVRFSSGRYVENSATEQIIKLNSLDYPVKIKASGTDLVIEDNIDGKQFRKALKDGEEAILTNPQINSIKVKSAEIPTEYSLSQNYPNPFNPVTKINYEIPQLRFPPLIKGDKGGFVTLRVYDILGRVVETLVNEPQEAGKYSVEWNAAKYSSGIYYYELRAGEFRAIKKMLLMK